MMFIISIVTIFCLMILMAYISVEHSMSCMAHSMDVVPECSRKRLVSASCWKWLVSVILLFVLLEDHDLRMPQFPEQTDKWFVFELRCDVYIFTLEKHQIWLEFATVLRRIDVHVGKDITSTPRKQAVIEPPKPTAVALASWVDEKWMEIGGIQLGYPGILPGCWKLPGVFRTKGGIHGHPKKWSLWVELKWTSYWLVHVHAGGLKTGPIFKRFADMCDKRTRWVHCYLQYFVHFQCSLHGHADSQIFIANLRQKKSSNFQNMHFVRVSCTFCQKNIHIVFSFSTCQLVRVGWGGGGW